MTTRPPLTLHRLTRFTTWARVWLEMIVRVLPAGGGLGPLDFMAEDLARRVAEMRVFALRLIFLRSDRRAGAPQKSPHDRVMTKHGAVMRAHQQRPTGLHRRLIGTRLRRLTHGKDLAAQIRALLDLLRDPEAEIARLARRLKRLKRRALFNPLTPDAPTRAPPLDPDVCINSS